MISGKDVKKLADLARIEVEESELEGLAGEMGDILEYVKSIQEFQSNEAESEANTLEGLEVRNVMREDQNPNEPQSFSKEIIAEFPDSEGDYLKVKKIL